MTAEERLPRFRREKSEPKPLALTTEVTEGVTAFWLSKAFGLDLQTTRKLLSDCPPMKSATRGHKYAIKDAAAYLVKPKADVNEVIKRMKPHELPAELRAAIWDARLKEQKWRAQAKDYWRTEDVLRVLGRVFQLLKSSHQLTPETIDRQVGLSIEQREKMVALLDALQNDFYQELVSLAEEHSTASAIGELEEDMKAQDKVEDGRLRLQDLL